MSATQPSSDPTHADVPPPPALGAYQTAHIGHVMAAVRELRHPTQIGPYAILELIGEGGMGSVYKAQQHEPIRRVVAVKIIKLGMDTREVITRFESERQALALMNHPNVAQVFDAGATEGGRPYFVMEYVDGLAITTYADRNHLTMRQRLELFVQACDAVQHAHQKAIIHRDLKPSNILVATVDGRPQVKVIDFGVAKATQSRLTERTYFTETGQLVGTPEYMAPEQAQPTAQLDVDTRTDVYSLGVVLYELLAGALPFDPKSLRSAGFQEIQRIIREVDPPRPSTKLSSLGAGGEEVALRRRMQLDALSKQLKRELEWIPLKAMRKDRDQRYATCTELSEDIAAYLANRPLRAGPESVTYRAQKFVRRNKRGVFASATMLLLLVAGIVTTTWQAVRAHRAERQALIEKHEAELQRQRAESASQNVREVNHFLTDDLLASASPEIARGRQMTVREALDRAAASITDRFRDRPLTEAAVRAAIADTYDALGETDIALPHAQAALDLLNRTVGPDDEQTLTAAHEVAREIINLNRPKDAEPALRELLARSRRLLGPDHPVTLTVMGTLGLALRMQEKYPEAEQLYRAEIDGDRRTHGPRSVEYAQSLNSLAVLLNTQHHPDQAEPLYREALAIKEKLVGRDHPTYLSSLANFARVLEDQGKLADAEAMFREALATKRRVLGDDHHSTTLTMNDLGILLFDEGKADEAEALMREALTRRLKAQGPDDIDTLQSKFNLGRLLTRREKYVEAEPLIREALAGRRKVLGEQHPYTVGTMVSLAELFERQQRFAEAEPLLAAAVQPDAMKTFPPPQQAIVIMRYGLCLAALNRNADAEPVLLDARRRLSEIKQPGSDVAMRKVLSALVKLYGETNRSTDAARWSELLTRLAPATQPTTAPASPATTSPVR